MKLLIVTLFEKTIDYACCIKIMLFVTIERKDKIGVTAVITVSIAEKENRISNLKAGERTLKRRSPFHFSGFRRSHKFVSGTGQFGFYLFQLFRRTGFHLDMKKASDDVSVFTPRIMAHLDDIGAAAGDNA